MRSLQAQAAEFSKRRLRILAISVDPPEVTREHAGKMDYSYPVFLADEEMVLLRRFDLVHEDGSFKVMGGDVARPPEFLVDSKGVIRWRFLATAYRRNFRLTGEMVLEVLDEIGAQEPH